MQKILVIEDKQSLAQMLRKTFELAGFSVSTCSNLKEAINCLLDGDIDVIVSDLKLPDGDGTEIIKIVKSRQKAIPIIIMTAHGTIEIAVKAVKEGAYDFITKPFDIDQLIYMVRKALSEKTSDNLEREGDDKESYLCAPLSNVIGISPVWNNIIEKVIKVAPLKTTILLLGESGTGKELIAKTIHSLSPRHKNPFVTINCAAIPRDLIENELFGHEKGAFTGAIEIKQGKFELANKGTIFLDEIGDMSLPLQSKLLRVLQESEFQRVGGTKNITVDVRVIAATNKDLQKEVRSGNFREDLFYRINVFPISIPPLRERKEDILPLANFFLNFFANAMNKGFLRISPEAERILLDHQWRGNVRELKNVIERAVILCDGSIILDKHICLDEKVSKITETPQDSLHNIKESALRSLEIAKIKEALQQSGGNKTKAAQLLKVSYKTLLTKIKEYKIENLIEINKDPTC
ncbi:MAG: sigma-54 dependent transcriptional regulator [Thermodesulfovibrionales bacterium]|nr:sigma-54 dependent transcriptional regulator [Thermodesulfovibrionales bacterium]